MKKSLIIKVKGKVQNVGFRYYTHKAALEHHLNGFVQNKSDGSVYIEVEGEESDVDHFVAWLHQGPTWARVEEVQVQETALQDYSCFRVR